MSLNESLGGRSREADHAEKWEAARAQCRRAHYDRESEMDCCPAPLGLMTLMYSEPKALPWAGLFGLFEAKHRSFVSRLRIVVR